MFVNRGDKEKELAIVQAIQVAGLLEGINIIQAKEEASIFDFHGYISGKEVIALDVKCRAISSNQYGDYFISKEKYNESRKEGTYWIVYWFEGDEIIKVFDLGNLRCESKDLQIIHKRSGEPTKSKVYLIPAESWLYRLR